jgi:hypothetical protein
MFTGLDDAITKLAAAQLITEEKLADLSAAHVATEKALQRFLEGRGTNGQGQA